MKIWVTPCSNRGAKIHLNMTVENFVSMKENLLLENGTKLNVGEKFKAWGFQSNYISYFESLKIGDLIYFYQDKKVVYKAEISEKIISKKLSNKIWVFSNDDNNWPLIVMIKNVEKIDLPIKEINQVLEYKPNYIFQRNTLFKGVQADKLLSLISEYEDDLILKISKDEFPDNYEKIKVKAPQTRPQQVKKTFNISKILNSTNHKDFIRKQEVNQKIGEKAEELVMKYIIENYGFNKNEVEIFSKVNNIAPFDIIAKKDSFQTFFEVKGTKNSSFKTNFYMSANEVDFAKHCFENNLPYKLIRVINLATNPQIFEVDIEKLINGDFLSTDVYMVSMSDFELEQ